MAFSSHRRANRASWKRRALGGCAAALLAAVASCTVFNDVEPPLGTSGSGGSGPGSSASVGASSGEGGASVSSSGSSSPVGSGGASEGPPTSYLTAIEAARLCRYVFMCSDLAESIAIATGIPLDTKNYSQCLTWAAGPVPSTRPGIDAQVSILKAVADASDCSEALSVLPYEVASSDDCVDGSRCDNDDTAVNCAGLLISHCGTSGFAGGSTCEVVNGTPRCVTGDCSVSEGASKCEEGALVTCNDGRETRASCAVAGFTCVEQSGSAWCAGAGVCADAGASWCDGKVLEACTGKEVSVFDCVSMGGECTGQKDQVRCALSGETCSPFDAGINVCSANKKKISVCVGGMPMSITCGDIGGSCVQPSGGVTAHCG